MTQPQLVYVGVAAFAAIHIAYTMSWQGATLFWGNAICPDNPMLPRGMQDAITPPAQNTRNGMVVVLLIGLLIAGFALFAWYVAIGALVLVWLASGLVCSLLPRPDSYYFRKRIRRSLVQRLEAYQAYGNILRQDAMEAVIAQFDLVAAGHITQSDQRPQSDAANSASDLDVEAERLIYAFADVLADHSEPILDARLLPASPEAIHEAFAAYIRHLEDLRQIHTSSSDRQTGEQAIIEARGLKCRIDEFQPIDPDDAEAVSDVNTRWGDVASRIKNDAASESDRSWAQNALALVVKYNRRGLESLDLRQ